MDRWGYNRRLLLMMILPSMSFKEMHECLLKDAKKLQIRKEKIYPNVVKKFRKSRSFPVSYVDEYRIPATNNQYVFFYYASNVNEVEEPHFACFCIIFSNNQRYVIQEMSMGYKHTPNSKMIMLPQIHAYKSHFFKRYNERFLHKEGLSANEIAGLFFIRNPLLMPIMLDEEINRNYKLHGLYNDRGIRVKDGFCFAHTVIEGKKSEDGISENDRVDSMGIIYNTFMNESDMTDTQKNAINKGHFEALMHCMENIDIIDNNGLF